MGRYSVMETDNKIIIEKLNKLINMEPKIMIHRLLMRDYKMIKLVSEYGWRYLTLKGPTKLRRAIWAKEKSLD